MYALIGSDMNAVDAVIRDRLHSDVVLVRQVAEYIIGAGGKRMRPALVLLAAGAMGYSGRHHHDLAAVVEFIHTATLLHDDVIDSSELRRGKVAAHLIWGAPASVLVGDFLFARSFELMVEAGSMPALEILARASRVIAEGEVLQLTRAHDLDLPQETYLEIIGAKTAELFAAASEAGAVSAGAGAGDCARLRRFGQNLGLAFQLVDDALDYSGASDTLGKNPGDDFREGQATLPLILAVARTGAEEQGFWERTVGRREQTEADFERARALIAGCGALESTLALAETYAAEAKTALPEFDSADGWKAAMMELADFAVWRRM